jgi:hypothetical protein
VETEGRHRDGIIIASGGRMRVISLMVVMGVAFVPPAAAAPQRGVSPPFSKLFREPPPPPSQPTPFLKPSAPLFPANRTSGRQGPSRAPAKVVCGMTLVPVDASLDPKIEHPVPAAGTKFTLKISKPPHCGQ